MTVVTSSTGWGTTCNGHVSLGALDRALTALDYQLPGAVSSASGLTAVPTIAV